MNTVFWENDRESCRYEIFELKQRKSAWSTLQMDLDMLFKDEVEYITSSKTRLRVPLVFFPQRLGDNFLVEHIIEYSSA